jgi:predicted nucleic acid-binding protein
VPIDDAVVERAIEVQSLIDRALPPIPLLVAAAAERAGLVLLHDDDVFDEIAAVTGQPIERVAG